MADEQRNVVPVPADDPAATPEPESGAVEPASGVALPEANAAASEAESPDATAIAPVPAVGQTASASSDAAPAGAATETDDSGIAPAAERGNPEAGEPDPVPETVVAEPEADAPALAGGLVEPGVRAPVVAAGATVPAAEGTDAIVVPAGGASGEGGAGEAAAEAVGEEQPTQGRRALTFFREFVETILLTLVIFVAVRTLVVNFRVDGQSMSPTLANGEYLLVNRATYFHFDLNSLRNVLPGPDRRDRDVIYLFGPPERGDIVVFEPPFSSDKPFVKRVIGLPGDTIAIREDHRVYVNGEPLEEGYIAAPPRNLYPAGGGAYTVPPGMIFVLGDNRNNSQDSRFFSAVSLDSVIGKAVVSYWPLDGFGFIPHERYAQAGDGE